MTELVTVTMIVHRDGSIESDVQTHDNCWADVYRGLAVVAKESERVLQSAAECPHFPKSKQEAHTPVIRREQPAQAVPLTDAEIDASSGTPDPTSDYGCGYYAGARWAEARLRGIVGKEGA